MTAMLTMAMFVVDVSYLYIANRQAQNAADAGALGAAQDLTGAGADTDITQDTAASADGTTVAKANDPNATVQVTAPYGGDATTAQAVVTNSVALPFGPTTSVNASAVAQNNVVQNGSFNATFTSSFIEYCAVNGMTTEGPQDWSCPIASPDMGSWTVYSGGVDLNDSAYIPAPSSDPTAESVDMVGSCSYDPFATPERCLNQPNGTIYEPLSIPVPGDTYTLQFDLSANAHGLPADKPLAVYVSSDIVPPWGFTNGTKLGPELYGIADGTNWTRESLTFVAPAATTYLWFFSQVNCDPSDGTAGPTTVLAPECRYGAAITDISVTGPQTDNLTQ